MVFGYFPANASGKGHIFFTDKKPPVGVQSYKMEARRTDQTAIVIFSANYNLAGPPSGDVVRSSDFDLPLLDAQIPTSFEAALEFLHFLLPLLHRHQDHHVENAENDGKRKKRYQTPGLTGARHRYK